MSIFVNRWTCKQVHVSLIIFFAYEQIDVITVLEIALSHQNILIYFGPFILKLTDVSQNALWTMFWGHSKIDKFAKIKFAPPPSYDTNVIQANAIMTQIYFYAIAPCAPDCIYIKNVYGRICHSI